MPSMISSNGRRGSENAAMAGPRARVTGCGASPSDGAAAAPNASATWWRHQSSFSRATRSSVTSSTTSSTSRQNA